MKRRLLPPALVMALALLFSTGLHLPAYLGLSKLGEAYGADADPPNEPIEIELIGPATDDAPPGESPQIDSSQERSDEGDESETEAEPDEGDEPEPATAHPATAQTPQAQAPQTPPPRPAEPLPQIPDPNLITPQPPAPPPPPTPEEQHRQSVQQRSTDPSVAPEQARFLAEENNRVEEETQASVRNQAVDDPETQLAAAEQASELPEEGDAESNISAELDDAPGEEEAVSSARQNPAPPRPASRSPRPQQSRAAGGPEGQAPGARGQGGRQGGAGSSAGASRGGGSSGGASEGQPSEAPPAAGGALAPPEMDTLVINDGNGTFVVRVPRGRPGTVPGAGGGGIGAQGGEGAQASRGGRGGRGRGRPGNRGASGAGEGGPNLQIGWGDFSSMYGAEELAAEREVRAATRRSHSRGAQRRARWQRFRSAIENYLPDVRPGNQTALNAAASPFAAYLAAMHNRVHRRFAGDFLLRPPASGEQVFRVNPSMHTKLEIVIGTDGQVIRIGVVGTSGDLLFDLGAYTAVMEAQPFGTPPESIRSPDGRTYFHWSFYRNHRQCGTFNAQPFLLAAPGTSVVDEPRDEGPTDTSEVPPHFPALTP